MSGTRSTPSPSVKKTRFFYGYVIVGVGFLCIALMWSPLLSFGLFLKPMSEEFGWSRGLPSGAYSLSMVMMGIFAILTGKLNDRYGSRTVVSIGSIVMGIGFALLSRIENVWQLYLIYGLMIGPGLSSAFVPLSSTVARWFYHRRGLMTGILLSGFGAANFVGAPVAERLITVYGWRPAYLILGLSALVALVLVAQLLRRSPADHGTVPYGSTNPGTASGSTNHQYSVAECLMTRQFWIVFMINILFGLTQMAVTVHLVPYATDLGVTTYVAATIMAVLGILNIGGRVGLGYAVDRAGSRRVLIIALVIVLISLVWLPVSRQTWMLFGMAALFGVGTGGVPAMMSPVIAELFGLKAHGAVLGLTALGWGMGSAIGPSLAGLVFDATAKYDLAFTIFAALGTVTLGLGIMLKPTGVKKTSVSSRLST